MTVVDYQVIEQQVASVFATETDLIAALANFSALLNDVLDEINWVGFYLLKEGELVLGPFQGKLACSRIPLAKGVCGTAAALQQTIRVDDVHQFDGHIACDSASNAELVIPLVVNNQLIGVLDIDSPKFARFSKIDQIGIENCLLALKKALFG